MISCESVRKQLSDYIVGNLGAGERRRIKEHLSICLECSKELVCLEETGRIVEALEQVEPPVGLWNGVYNRITQPEEEIRRQRSHWGWPKRVMAMGSFAAAAVVMAVGLINGPERHESLPLADSAMQEYVRGHAMLSAQNPFADRVSLGTLANASSESDERL